MMHYPVLSRVVAGRQLYVQQNRLQLRGLSSVTRTELDPDELTGTIVREFGIAPGVAAQALAILQRQGEGHGGTTAS
jgi:hypothetical protein